MPISNTCRNTSTLRENSRDCECSHSHRKKKHFIFFKDEKKLRKFKVRSSPSSIKADD